MISASELLHDVIVGLADVDRRRVFFGGIPESEYKAVSEGGVFILVSITGEEATADFATVDSSRYNYEIDIYHPDNGGASALLKVERVFCALNDALQRTNRLSDYSHGGSFYDETNGDFFHRIRVAVTLLAE